MEIWFLIPVKRLERAKSRLAAVLPQRARIRLTWRLTQRTLRVVARVPEVHPLVISADLRVLALARSMGLDVYFDRWEDLNRALTAARRYAVRHGAEGIGVLPIDLPRVTPEAIRALLQAGFPDRGLVLVPDQRAQGTNALLLRPPEALPFRFGPGSLEAFQAEARARGLPVRLFHHEALTFDLDTEADWAAWRARADLTKR
ncbi:2-phospho-L-lactate guanylyltransferase [Thermoflexus sp.]|uniref:2-phospho-L-lactate guanylyltransferase n=1 Tax=Thermoflexus sp. TaxID=1969742 RepID=UPI001773F2FF|nr:2-phospho-L-lactate guanylyltransferase [Thermoflexus sp.]